MQSVSEVRSALIAIVQWLVIHRWDLVYRVAVALLLIAWLQIFPMYLVTIYTGAQGIPPFEIATDELAGVHLMLTWTLLVLCVSSLYFWSPLIYFILRRFYLTDPIRNSTLARPPSRFALFLTSLRGFWIFLPTIVIAAALAVAFRSGHVAWDAVFQLLLSSLLLTLSIFLFVRRNVADAIVNWQGPVAFILLSIVFPFAFMDAVVGTLDSTLRQYRVGGKLPVTVHWVSTQEKSANRVDGRLLLLGTHRIYVEQGEGDQRTLVVISNGENIRVDIGR